MFASGLGPFGAGSSCLFSYRRVFEIVGRLLTRLSLSSTFFYPILIWRRVKTSKEFKLPLAVGSIAKIRLLFITASDDGGTEYVKVADDAIHG